VGARIQDFGIADIAFDSGFGDISYFYRQFRRRYGEAPGAFRTRRILVGPQE